MKEVANSVVLMPNTRARITYGNMKGCQGVILGFEVDCNTLCYVINLDEYGEVSVFEWAVQAVKKEVPPMVRVTYHFPENDDNSDGKYEAILEVVCAEGNKSDVLVSAGRKVVVDYAEDERGRLEPSVLAIMQNTDGTFWEIAERQGTALKEE